MSVLRRLVIITAIFVICPNTANIIVVKPIEVYGYRLGEEGHLARLKEGV